jgi:hypothetical protein
MTDATLTRIPPPSQSGYTLSRVSGWIHAAACVVVPAAWGIAMFYVFEAIDRRRLKRAQREAPPPIDYSI